jgi:hypothetical protein
MLMTSGREQLSFFPEVRKKILLSVYLGYKQNNFSKSYQQIILDFDFRFKLDFQIM